VRAISLLAAQAVAIVAFAASSPVRAQSSADRERDVESALDQYGAAKTPAERAAVFDFVQHLDRPLVAEAVVDHIVASRNGTEATLYGQLVAPLSPASCAALEARLKDATTPTVKGKLIVALRHCHGPGSFRDLIICLDDKRTVPFEAHGPAPRRVCDLAYDELFLKLRAVPQYGLDPTPRMRDAITETMPVRRRNSLIAKLKFNLLRFPPTPLEK